MDDLEELMAAAQLGDRLSLSALIRSTQPQMLRVASLLVSPSAAEDVVQEAYVRAIGGLATYRREAPPMHWLLGVLRRTAADHVRRAARRRSLLARHRATLQTTTADAGSQVELAAVVRSLPLDRREAFVLTQVLGFRYDEAAVIVGCPVGTIRSRVARARQELIAVLGEERERDEESGAG